jgi:hypothetical protein
MSRKLLPRILPKIKNTILPKSLLRAGNAGVIADTMGAGPSSVRVAQQGFAAGLFSRMTIYGVDYLGKVHEKIDFTVNPLGSAPDELVAISGDDSLDYITRTDAGMAEALRHSKARFDRKGLRASPTFTFTDDIHRDPERLARLQNELGISTALPYETAPGLESPVLSIAPARDPQQRLSLYWRKPTTGSVG